MIKSWSFQYRIIRVLFPSDIALKYDGRLSDSLSLPSYFKMLWWKWMHRYLHYCWFSKSLCNGNMVIKGILWDRRWIAPSIGIFPPHMLICLQKCISNHETKQSFKIQSDPSPNCFTIDVWNVLSYFFYFFISFYTSSVVFWYVIFWE